MTLTPSPWGCLSTLPLPSGAGNKGRGVSQGNLGERREGRMSRHTSAHAQGCSVAGSCLFIPTGAEIGSKAGSPKQLLVSPVGFLPQSIQDLCAGPALVHDSNVSSGGSGGSQQMPARSSSLVPSSCRVPDCWVSKSQTFAFLLHRNLLLGGLLHFL